MELKIRTVFNLLGPLTNPAGADGQVIGVFDASRVEDVANVLVRLGTRRAFVVAGSDGLDEITITAATRVAEAKDGSVTQYEITPEDAGLTRSDGAALQGGDAEVNARIMKAVLETESGPRRDIVVLNAAAAILAGEGAIDWKEGVARAEESIDSGAAFNKLNELIERSGN